MSIERVTGVEPVSSPWQGDIMATIRYPPNIISASGQTCTDYLSFFRATLYYMSYRGIFPLYHMWALRDSDPRPSRCKRDALTNCAKCPLKRVRRWVMCGRWDLNPHGASSQEPQSCASTGCATSAGFSSGKNSAKSLLFKRAFLPLAYLK